MRKGKFERNFPMKEIILLKCGEMVLKGLNRSTFTAVLLKNIRRRLAPLGKFEITSAQSTIYIDPKDESCDIDFIVENLSKIFGIATLSVGAKCQKDLEKIKEIAAQYLATTLSQHATFKVEVKRSDKKFPLTSPQIAAEVGGYLLDRFSTLTVDVHDPQITVYVEIRDFDAYVHAGKLPGAGGMPLGTGGKATLLLSGGIDSPVAGYMIAKRGVTLNAVHFFSHPYTSQQAKEKVFELSKLMCDFCGRMTLYVVPFTDIQLAIRQSCREEYFTIIMRRFMVKISCEIAKKHGSLALITGESIGQVASQTLPAMLVTDEISDLPIFRPCIGMDKAEIISVARKINTFETSILPYEDCCTVFTPKHPKLNPELSVVHDEEKALDWDELIQAAMDKIEIVYFNR
jgi:thiamine biosynthesis protein ThiI